MEKSNEKIMMYSKYNDYIMSFNSLRGVCLFLKKENHAPKDITITKMKSNICHCISGKSKTSYGFVFKKTNK